MTHRIAVLTALTFLAASHAPADAQQRKPGAGTPTEIRALLVGIDDYRYVPKLKGATNDAEDIAGSLRLDGARDVRVMLNDAATRGSLLVEFQNLVSRTNDGDTVFLGLSGHGAQEPERIKGSEPDGMDEVFLLSGFDPTSSERNGEKILDKEFNHFIKQLEDKGAHVVFIADTCSGGGLARSVDPRGEEMIYRSVKYIARPDNLKPVSTRDDALLSPIDFKATTFLAAVDKQSKVPELRIPGVGYRGALSYAVARGLEGAADLDGDGRITAVELSEYAKRVTYQLSDQRQQIVVANAAGLEPPADLIVRVNRGISVVPVDPNTQKTTATPTQPVNIPPTQPTQPTQAPVRPQQPQTVARPSTPPSKTQAVSAPAVIRIASLDGQASRFTGLSLQTQFEVVAPTANPDVIWDPTTRDVLAGGDIIARGIDRNDLPSVIERTAAVRWLKMRATLAPQAIRINPDDKLHSKGSRVEVEVSDIAGKSLILFNVAGDGTVQMLYPIGSDPSVRSEGKYRLQVQVREPFGADQIIAVTSPRRLPELEQALRQLDRRRNPIKIAELITQYGASDTLVGSAGIFTSP